MHSWLTKHYRKLHGLQPGQTMTEYALILSAVAVAVFYSYRIMGFYIFILVYNLGLKLR